MSGDLGGRPATRFSGIRQVLHACAAVLVAGAAACTPLTAFNALVPKDAGAVRVAKGLAYGADPRQRLDIYAPSRTEGASRLPVIVWIYGGSWSSGERGGYGFVGRALAARGFVVAVPDYRLVPQVRFPAFLEDNAAAVRWVRAHAADFGGDPDRLVLAGHSAGAYNVSMLAMDGRWLGADRRAVRGWVGLAGPYDFLPLEGPITTATFGAWPNPRETQPVTFPSAGDPPAFLAAGSKDAVVNPRNVPRLGGLLADAGVTVEEHVYPGITHVGLLTAIARPFRGRAPVLADMAAFAHQVTERGTTAGSPAVQASRDKPHAARVTAREVGDVR